MDRELGRRCHGGHLRHILDPNELKFVLKKEFDETKINFSIYNKGRLKKVFVTERLRID